MPPRKTATPRKPAVKKAEQKIAAFDSLRQRAAGLNGIGLLPRNAEPFVLGSDQGFDPPLEARFPSQMVDKVALDIATRRDDVVLALQILLGDDGLMRALAALSTEPDAESLLIGLYMRIKDHFLGPGAGDVAGGTPAS